MKIKLLSHGLLLAIGLAGGLAVTALSGQDPGGTSTTESATATATEDAPVESPLHTLDWMVGDWLADSPTHSSEFSIKYAKNNAFLVRAFKVVDKADPERVFSGMQIVAWDPAQSALRSWTFDASGGFGEDVWSQLGDKYTLRAKYTLHDGGRGASINYLDYLDENTFTWKSTHREIDGELQPDSEEIVFQRVASEVTESGN
jgi:hypothetical protein